MAWPGKEITGRHRRDVAEKDATGGIQAGGDLLGIADGEGDMLGREAVGDFHGLIQIADADEYGVCHRLGQMLGARGERRLAGDLLLHRGDELVRIAEQNDDTADAVFGLSEKIRGHPDRVGLGVGDHQNLAGPGKQVDADPPEYLALRLDDVGVARAEDLGHGADRLGSVGQGGDRLGATDTINLGGTA